MPTTDDDRDAPRPLHDVLEGLRVAMVTTALNGELSARPLTVLEIDSSTLRFLVAGDAEWAAELDRGPGPAHVAFSYPSDNRFVALSGRARLSADRATIDRLWSPAATAFFENPDDPRIRVLEIDVHDGEYWDGPGSGVGQALAFVRAVVTGSAGDLGEHGAVRPD